MDPGLWAIATRGAFSYDDEREPCRRRKLLTQKPFLRGVRAESSAMYIYPQHLSCGTRPHIDWKLMPAVHFCNTYGLTFCTFQISRNSLNNCTEWAAVNFRFKSDKMIWNHFEWFCEKIELICWNCENSRWQIGEKVLNWNCRRSNLGVVVRSP